MRSQATDMAPGTMERPYLEMKAQRWETTTKAEKKAGHRTNSSSILSLCRDGKLLYVSTCIQDQSVRRIQAIFSGTIGLENPGECFKEKICWHQPP